MEENKTQEKLFTPETKTILFLVDTQEKCTKYVGTNKKDFPIIEVVFEAIKYFLREFLKFDDFRICVILHNTKVTKN